MVNALKNLLKGQPEPGWLSNCHLRGYDLPLPVLDDLAAQGYGLLGSDINRGGPGAEGEPSRLGDEPHWRGGEGGPGRIHEQDNPPCLSWRSVEPSNNDPPHPHKRDQTRQR